MGVFAWGTGKTPLCLRKIASIYAALQVFWSRYFRTRSFRRPMAIRQKFKPSLRNLSGTPAFVSSPAPSVARRIRSLPCSSFLALSSQIPAFIHISFIFPRKSSYPTIHRKVFLVFHLSRHAYQASSFMNLKFSVSCCDWVSACFNSQFIRSSSQSRHHCSCFAILLSQVCLEAEFLLETDVGSQLRFL